MSSTAGKGPGLVYRAGNRSGTLRISIPRGTDVARLEILGQDGKLSMLSLTVDELRVLAKSLQKVAAALMAATTSDEVTKS